MLVQILRWCICLLVAASGCAIGAPQGFKFNSYRYLVVCEPTAAPRASTFADPARNIIHAPESQARRLALIVVSAGRQTKVYGGPDQVDEALSKEIRRVAFHTRCHETDNYMDLIGLDGQTKMVWRDHFPDIQDLYAFIDSMPMRQEELRRRSSE